MPDSISHLTDELELEAIILDECQVSRGTAEDAQPGQVHSEIDVEFSQQENVVFFISSKHRLLNRSDVLIAEISATFVATYSYSGPDPEPAAIEEYAENALMIQVLPFMREFLASMTNRIGVPTFYLPLFRNRSTAPPAATRRNDDSI